ncbi:uncharacterized protein ACMZJ9_011323 [Mantella aurantiaca]
MKPVAVVKTSHLTNQKCRSLYRHPGMGKSKTRYEKRLSQILHQVPPTSVQQQWAGDQLSGHRAGITPVTLVALEAARLSRSQRRNSITCKEICTALRNLKSAGGRDSARNTDF